METILAMDIGAGTQDLFLFEKEVRIENCIKIVLPSRAALLAQRVEQLTLACTPIFLDGNIMGSRFLSTAIRKHIQSGSEVYATPLAAKTFRDNLDQVRAMGVKICEKPPFDMPILQLGDLELAPIHRILNDFDKPLPSWYLIAVQDHGECLEGSNRQVRFNYWRNFLQSGGELKKLLFDEIPPLFTRMRAVRNQLTRSYLMDTGPAALLGSLFDPIVKERESEGVILVNLGNQHTLAALVINGRILGLFEHHTCFMSPEKIMVLLSRFRAGKLTYEEIYDDKGHGCVIHNDYKSFHPFEFISVTGPQRFIVNSCGFYQAVPYGDMMMTGCFGLLGAGGFLKI